MKKHIVIFSVITSFLWGIQFLQVPTEAVNSFPDVPQDTWMYPYIEELVNDGIVEGYSDGNFYPWQTANRAEVAKMIVLMRAQMQSSWLQQHFIEIVLVIATIIGWMSILSAFKRSQRELILELKEYQGQKGNPAPEAPKAATNPKENSNTETQKEEVPYIKESADKPESEENESDAIEKNLKSNWWV